MDQDPKVSYSHYRASMCLRRSFIESGIKNVGLVETQNRVSVPRAQEKVFGPRCCTNASNAALLTQP